MNEELTTADERLTLCPMSKDELIYTRISTSLKNRLAIEANRRGEAEAVIVREALNSYFARHAPQELHETPPPYTAGKTKRRK